MDRNLNFFLGLWSLRLSHDFSPYKGLFSAQFQSGYSTLLRSLDCTYDYPLRTLYVCWFVGIFQLSCTKRGKGHAFNIEGS